MFVTIILKFNFTPPRLLLPFERHEKGKKIEKKSPHMKPSGKLRPLEVKARSPEVKDKLNHKQGSTESEGKPNHVKRAVSTKELDLPLVMFCFQLTFTEFLMDFSVMDLYVEGVFPL